MKAKFLKKVWKAPSPFQKLPFIPKLPGKSSASYPAWGEESWWFVNHSIQNQSGQRWSGITEHGGHRASWQTWLLSKREGPGGCSLTPVICCHVGKWSQSCQIFRFFFSQEKPEIWNFMRNLPIFKSWQLIQNIFKTLHGPKRKKKKSMPTEWSGTLDCDLFPKRRELCVICWALCSAHAKLAAVLQAHTLDQSHLSGSSSCLALSLLSAWRLLLILQDTTQISPSPLKSTFPGMQSGVSPD